MGDDPKESKASYCTEILGVNREVTWTESVLSYPERSENLLDGGTIECQSEKQKQ